MKDGANDHPARADEADQANSVIYLLDTSEDHDVCASDLGVEPEMCGQLITPLTRFANRGRTHFAIDNGGFSKRDPKGFESLLKREEANRTKCIFVAMPDVVCNARRTLELFDLWYPRLHKWPLALVLQNGIEDFAIPWDRLKAVFIGGDDAFKGSDAVNHIVAAAQWEQKWVHMGRVNTPSRVALAEEMGCDSIDGSGLARYSHMRRAVASQRSLTELV